jgi:hypothetical protein
VRPVRLAYQPPASSTFLSEQISHQQPASSTLLSEQTSTSHQPPANRTGWWCALDYVMPMAVQRWAACARLADLHPTLTFGRLQPGSCEPPQHLAQPGMAARFAVLAATPGCCAARPTSRWQRVCTRWVLTTHARTHQVKIYSIGLPAKANGYGIHSIPAPDG